MIDDGFLPRVLPAVATTTALVLGPGQVVPAPPVPAPPVPAPPAPVVTVPVVTVPPVPLPPLVPTPDLRLPPLPLPRVPGDLLDLSTWKLTLPTGAEGEPDEILAPELATFTGPWFRLTDARDGVVFAANAGGVTTEGSDYPRSELREMRGGDKAAWSAAQGRHVLRVRQAVTRLPEVKPHVVTAQIHGGEDDVVLVRLEGERLLAQYDDGGSEITIDPAYVLGTPFDLEIVAADRHIVITYNGRPAADIPRSGSGWYFKAGSYVQSNPERGDAPDAVGEVVIYALEVEHNE